MDSEFWRRLTQAIARAIARQPYVQRLGYLLDAVGQGEVSAPLAEWLAKRHPRVVLLQPGLGSGAEVDPRRRVVPNTGLDVDVWSRAPASPLGAAWPTNEQVEQDLVLPRALVALFNQKIVADQAVVRGGTALHKLFIGAGRRYSEDIDLLQRFAGAQPFLRMGRQQRQDRQEYQRNSTSG